MNRSSLDHEIIDYLVERIFFYVGFGRDAFETLSLVTSLNCEIGLDGEDANDLMSDCFSRFGVSPGDYDHYRYFKPEGTDLFVLFRSKERRAKAFMTRGMLYEAVKLEEWNCHLLEGMKFSAAPICGGAKELPIKGFAIKTR